MRLQLLLAAGGAGTLLCLLNLVFGWLPMRAAAFARRAERRPFVNIPDTVSAEAQKFLETLSDPAAKPALPGPDDRVGWKRICDAVEEENRPQAEAARKRFQAIVEEKKLGGVPVLDIKPKGWKDNGKVLVYTHGGGYATQSVRSRLPSSLLAADATGLRVIAVEYTLAPAGKWQQVTGEVLAVFSGLREQGYKLQDIAIYGESAGGALAAGSVLKMRDRGLGMPAAVVLWSAWADITDSGDSAVTLKHADPNHLYDKHLKTAAHAYADPKDQKHPYVSPVYGDYSKGFPPTLIQGGTKEIFLSHFVRLYRAIDRAGGVAVLDLYDGMPHNFQFRPAMWDAPESKEAMRKMKTFLRQYLEK